MLLVVTEFRYFKRQQLQSVFDFPHFLFVAADVVLALLHFLRQKENMSKKLAKLFPYQVLFVS